MKHQILIFASIVLLAACKGSKPSDGPANPNNNIPINFELTGLHDVEMLQTDTLEMLVDLNYLSGTKEKVSLGVNNLVDKFVISFTPAIDTPSYTANLRIITQGADTGNRTFQILATGTKLTKPYNLTIKVKPDPINPAAAFAGPYMESGSCTNDNPTGPATISVDPNVTGRIRIQGIYASNNAYTVFADLDEANGTVNIPLQQTNSLNFSGSGTYSGTTLQITYTVTGTFVNESCTVTLTKQ